VIAGVVSAIMTILTFVFDYSNEYKNNISDSVPTSTLALKKKDFALVKIVEGKSYQIDFAKTTFAVSFDNYEGREYAKLVISPNGSKAQYQSIFGSVTRPLEFISSDQKYVVNVISLNIDRKALEISVAKLK